MSNTEKTKQVYVNWELDGNDIHDVNVPSIVDVPSCIPEEEISDWLSDEYGWLVSGWKYTGNESNPTKKTFTVSRSVSIFEYVDVEAETEEEAIEIAQELDDDEWEENPNDEYTREWEYNAEESDE